VIRYLIRPSRVSLRLRRICISELQQLTDTAYHLLFRLFFMQNPSLPPLGQRGCKRNKHPLHTHPQHHRRQSHHHSHARNNPPSHLKCIADLQLSHLPYLLVQMPRFFLPLPPTLSLLTVLWAYRVVRLDMCGRSPPPPARVAGVLIRFWIKPSRRVEVCEKRGAGVSVCALGSVTEIDEAEREDEGDEEHRRENNLCMLEQYSFRERVGRLLFLTTCHRRLRQAHATETMAETESEY
jgi:hypothetical protein